MTRSDRALIASQQPAKRTRANELLAEGVKMYGEGLEYATIFRRNSDRRMFRTHKHWDGRDTSLCTIRKAIWRHMHDNGVSYGRIATVCECSHSSVMLAIKEAT